MIVSLLLLLIGLAAAVYVHALVGTRAASTFQAWLIRAVLLVVGIGFGLVGVGPYQAPVPDWLAFGAGFGAVHIPPAAVLFIKRQRLGRR